METIQVVLDAKLLKAAECGKKGKGEPIGPDLSGARRTPETPAFPEPRETRSTRLEGYGAVHLCSFEKPDKQRPVLSLAPK